MFNLKKRKILKDAYIEMFANSDPKYHFTIVFRPNSFNKETITLLDKFIIHLNKSIYKNRYRDNKSKLGGFVVRERGKSTKVEFNKILDCDHYHILFSGLDSESHLPDHDAFLKHIEKQINYLNLGKTNKGVIPKAFAEKLTPNYKRPIRKWLLQNYKNENFDNKLEKYLLKVTSDWSKDNDYVFSCVGLIGKEKVEFGVSPSSE